MTDEVLIIGRFQPLHEGHQYGLIEAAQEEYDAVTIGIGVSGDESSCDNPLTYEEREQMLAQVYDDITTMPINDQGDDVLWQEEVQDQASAELETDSFTVLTGNDWVYSCLEDERTPYHVELLDKDDMYNREQYQGTDIRQRASNGQQWHHLVDNTVASYLDAIGFEMRLDTGECYEQTDVEG